MIRCATCQKIIGHSNYQPDPPYCEQCTIESLKKQLETLKTIVEATDTGAVLINLSKKIVSLYPQLYNEKNMSSQMQYLLGEVRELCEAYMVKGNAHQGNIGIAKKSGDYTPLKNTIEDELADIFIIALGICGYYNVDILWWVKQKMAYNATRTDKKHLENIRGNNGKKTI